MGGRAGLDMLSELRISTDGGGPKQVPKGSTMLHLSAPCWLEANGYGRAKEYVIVSILSVALHQYVWTCQKQGRRVGSASTFELSACTVFVSIMG